MKKDLFPIAISEVVKFYLILDNFLIIRLIHHLKKMPKNSISKQDLLKQLDIKNYKNYHNALRRLQEIGVIKLDKVWDQKGQPIMISLFTPPTDADDLTKTIYSIQQEIIKEFLIRYNFVEDKNKGKILEKLYKNDFLKNKRNVD